MRHPTKTDCHPVTVPELRTLKAGTLRAILRDADLSGERFRELSWAPLAASSIPKRRLTCMHISYILICMRTTLNIDDDLLDEARWLSGINEKTALVRAALAALIARQSAKRLATLGGSERGLRGIPRRRYRTMRKPA